MARNYLITERPDVILNIVDGTNLERNLYLSTPVSYTHLDVYKRQGMKDLPDRPNLRNMRSMINATLAM